MRFTPQMRQLSWLVSRPIAHRGLHSTSVPENSILAFAAAMERNYAIECDIQLSADGEAVVFHDDTLDRMTNVTGLVKAKTASELGKMRLADANTTIPTLAEVLNLVSGKVPLVIEIKTHWDDRPDLTLRTLDVVKHYAGSFALMSFDPAIIALLAQRAPQLARGIVADRVQSPYYNPISVARRVSMRQFAHLDQTAPHFVSFDANGLPFEPVQQIRAAGIPVITWTITDKEAAHRASRYVDQITFENYLPE